MSYSDEDMLMLSGIQHFVFCPRQWALIHLDQQWKENGLTTSGAIMHSHVDDPFYRPSSSHMTVVRRALPICSHRLGLYGIADVVEFIASPNGVSLSIDGNSDCWRILPVEYKHGEAKESQCDIFQVVAQAMALEEMFHTQITEGALYYGRTRHRVGVPISEDLKRQVSEIAAKMHSLCSSGILPKPSATMKNSCKSCSLKDICMPRQSKMVSTYLKEAFE